MDRTLEYLRRAEWMEVGQCFFDELSQLRDAVTLDEWHRLTAEVAHQHPAFTFVQQDPFSHYASRKPRGYAGDAVLLDFLYRDGLANRYRAEASPIGNRICEIFMTSPAAASVRDRRDLFANEMDRLAARKDGGRVLSVACGHLREAALSEAVTKGHLELVGLDQDSLSLDATKDLVAEASPVAKVYLVNASIGKILRAAVDLGKFDLIYAAGLYDYLEDGVAQKLAHRLFDLLNPRGTLAITNFLRTNVNAASMEVFQQWRLLYRNRNEIEAIADLIPRERVTRSRYSEDAHRCVGYYMVTSQ